MNKLPTVCFLTGTLNAFAGAERMTAVIASALAERGYKVFVLSLWDRASVFPLHANVEHHALFDERPSFKRQYVSTVLGIRRFVREHGIEVLVEVDTMLTLFTLPATLGMRVRRIAWEHCHFDEDLGKPVRRIARQLAARCNEDVVVLTRRDRERWCQMTRPRATISVVPNPLPFSLPPATGQAREPVLLSVGRLVPAKGHDVLLRAWAVAAPQLPGWRLRIIGEGESRPLLEALRSELGLSDSVELPGVTDQIEHEYRHSGLFCLSSHYEGYGLVLLEAMAYGLPVVATDCETGPKEMLRNNHNALVVPPGDTESMARAIVLLATADSTMQKALTSAGRQLAASQSLDVIAGVWEQILTAPEHRPGLS